MKRRLFQTCLMTTPLIISGCLVSPKPFTPKQRSEQFASNLTQLEAARPPLKSTLSLHQAIARSIKFNLDYRVTIAEQAISQTDPGITNIQIDPRQ